MLIVNCVCAVWRVGVYVVFTVVVVVFVVGIFPTMPRVSMTTTPRSAHACVRCCVVGMSLLDLFAVVLLWLLLMMPTLLLSVLIFPR